jgi:hypothetical protein
MNNDEQRKEKTPEMRKAAIEQSWKELFKDYFTKTEFDRYLQEYQLALLKKINKELDFYLS